MIVELADIRIHPNQNAAFEEAIKQGIATVAASLWLASSSSVQQMSIESL